MPSVFQMERGGEACNDHQVLLGLIGAAISAVAYGAATILQAMGVVRMKDAPKGASLMERAKFGWLYAVGLGLDGIGFLTSASALHSLPLFLVQSVVASSVAVTAILAVLFLHTRLAKREWISLGGVAAGLILLAITAQEGPSHNHHRHLALWVLLSAIPVAAVAAWGYVRKSGTILALAAGLGFSGVGIAARIFPWHGLEWHLLTTYALWALAAHGAIAVVAYGFALEAGEVTSVAAISFATETLIPALFGLVFLGDAVRPHTSALAFIGFGLTLAGCIGLAGRSEQSA